MRPKNLARSATWAVLAAGVVLLFAVRAVHADLETTFPPGTPNDWFRELPERVPHLRGIAPPKKEEKKPEPRKEEPKSGGTQTREKKHEAPAKEPLKTEVRIQPELGSSTYQPMIFSGVLTVDLPIHCGWVKRTGELGPRAYPPAVTDDLYWMAQVSFLRRLLHPAMVGEVETYWHLVELGDCAREVAKGAKGERFLEGLAKAVDAGIPELPKDAPEIPDGGDSPEEKMLRHLVRDDLADGDPYSLDPTYAARVLSLGEPAFPAVAAAAASPHPLLRRGAVVLLGNYPEPEAGELLRKLWKEDKDPVVRTRAFYHLAKRKDTAIVPDLATQLGGDDARLRPLAAFGLGMIGAREGVEPLVQAIEKNKDDWDTIVACTIALARAGSENPSVALPALKKLEESLRAPGGPRFAERREVPRPEADVPDKDEVKNRMLLELATIALARLGDKEGLARLNALLAGKYEDPKAPVGWANVSGPQRADQCECMKWVCPSSYLLLVETWAARGAEDAGYLQQVVLDEKANERLRVTALHAEVLAKNKKFLADVVATTASPGVRSAALRELANVDEKLGVRAAEGVLGLYDSGKPMSVANPKGDTSVVTALEVLFHAKKLKLDMIKPAVVRALGEFVYEKPEVTAEGMKPFRFSPPILETCAWMLGALGDKAGFSLLKTIATSSTAPAGHAEAVRALAHLPGEPTLQLLAGLLETEDDGWLRYNAYLSLRALTGQDHFCDWIYGSKDDRKEATAKYKELAKKK